MVFAVLFVCTGNICRSPTAEAVFRHQVKQHNMLELFEIDSAGTHGYHVGHPPDERSEKAALARGISMKGQSARSVQMDDFMNFDLMLAMDEGHYQHLERMRPAAARAEVKMFLDYHPSQSGSVPDPYYGGAKGFDNVFDMIEEASTILLQSLKKKLQF